MANPDRKSEMLPLVLRFVFMAVLVGLSESWEIPYREKQCGTLYSLNYLGGEQFPFKDGYESANLVEDYRASVFGWNLTNSIRVAPGCRMEICNETYFDGVCLPVEQGSYPLLSAQLHPNFSGDVRSVSCNCKRECKCEDIFMKKSSCARAYLKGGCKTCNSYYTELANLEYYFSENFQGKVEAFRLRRGCRLTLYTEEDLEGEEEIISNEILENYNGTFSSYECECNDDEYVPRVPPPRPIAFPPLVDVPGSVDDVIKMLTNETNKRHPGLVAALKSMQNRRSGKNAYILLLGSVGTGKGTTINMLLDNPNITQFSARSSSITPAISEFRIPIQVDDLGIANSELRVINTPGTGDTRGFEQDAKYLATLENYLETHEELKHRIPNVVLIFHKYNDNRFNGTGARFVKMLQGLESFRPRITDENYSNVIFVLTHFCSETRANRRRPTNRLNEFKRVIEEYSLFPKPIHLVVTENKPHDLPLLNGYYKLPNNEYYPRNLFEKLELVTKNGQDMIGMGVFRTAFRDTENLNVTSSRFPYVDRENPNVDKYLRILSSHLFPVTRASAIITTTSPPRTNNIQRERPKFILQLQHEDYNEDRKALVEMKLQEFTIVKKIRQEENRSKQELERSILPMRTQLQSLSEGMERETTYERMERAYQEFYMQLRDTRLRIERELELKTMEYRKKLSVIRNQMESLNEALHHKLLLQRLAWEREQKRLNLIFNWNNTQNATAAEARVTLLQDLGNTNTTEEVIMATQITQINSTSSSPSIPSCLKSGTKILMADLTEKPVELLQVGDTIMDIDFKPTRVLGVAHEFLLDQNFFGFDNQSFFFTNNHIFVGPSQESDQNFKLYAKSTKTLFHNNPLMKYLNVSDMDEYDTLKLFHFDNKNFTLEQNNVAVTQDPQEYPPETPIYFLQVDSPTGTYFANGYVCRHEIPPVEYWPNTMGMLFRLMGTKTFENLAQLPYNMETVSFLQNGISQVAVAVKQFLEENVWQNLPTGKDYKIMALDDVNVDECIGKIFSNPTLSTAGVGLYARVGEIVAPYLDDVAVEVGIHKLGRDQIDNLQNKIYHVMIEELEKLFKLVK